MGMVSIRDLLRSKIQDLHDYMRQSGE
ncbi:MAG: hypothetical protein ACE37K_11850 [Planctomycetota bacterium]